MTVRDIDFLRVCPSDSQVIVYGYRSGALRSSVDRKLRTDAESAGRVYAAVELGDLIDRWDVPDLFDTSVVCSLSMVSSVALRAEFNVLMECLKTSPSRPVALIVPATSQLFTGLKTSNFSGVTLIEEQKIDADNIADHLGYLAQTTDLPVSSDVVTDPEFLAHFRAIYDQGDLEDVGALRHEFDRVILTCVDKRSGRFIAPERKGELADERSDVVRSLRRIVGLQVRNTDELVHALWLKQRRGWSGRELVFELCRATEKLVSEKSEPHAGHELDRALLWGICLWTWCYARTEGEIDDKTDSSTLLIDVDCLVREFLNRCSIVTDPLAGSWQKVRQYVSEQEPIGIADPFSQPQRLLAALRQRAAHGVQLWCERLKRVLELPAANHAVESAVSHAGSSCKFVSLSDLLGQDSAIEAIRARFSHEDHRSPLLITGPEGAGKTTFARGYAKALLCEATLRGVDPCEVCEACRTFETGSFGYVEFDLEALQRIDLSRNHAVGTEARRLVASLQTRPISRHQVFIIKNADAWTANLDVFLKSLENSGRETTFILLSENWNLVRSAARSRCWDIRLQRLEDCDARTLVGRWGGADPLNEEQLSLIVSYAAGIPGQLRLAYEALRAESTSTSEDARQSLGIDWGREAIAFWHRALSVADQREALIPFSDVSPTEKYLRLKRALVGLRPYGCLDGEQSAVFSAFGADIKGAGDLLNDAAARLNVDGIDLWDALAREWTRDCYFDGRGFEDLIVKTRYLIETGINY